MPKFKDITSQRFGRLVVIRPVGNSSNGSKLWLCKCDCGKFRNAIASALRCDQAKSCGCQRGNYKHGHAKRDKRHHPLYSIWAVMHDRCRNPNNKSYKNYGGRGIKVDPRWNNFSRFIADVGKRPRGRTLDRTNNNGNYSPTNFRWATYAEQATNRRKVTTLDQFTVAELKAELKRRKHLKQARVPSRK